MKTALTAFLLLSLISVNAAWFMTKEAAITLHRARALSAALQRYWDDHKALPLTLREERTTPDIVDILIGHNYWNQNTNRTVYLTTDSLKGESDDLPLRDQHGYIFDGHMNRLLIVVDHTRDMFTIYSSNEAGQIDNVEIFIERVELFNRRK